MDKFSLYDFLSYFLPGMLACFIVFQYIPESWHTFRSLGEVADGLVLLAFALAMGLGIHRISFLFLGKKWFQWLIYTPVSKIVKHPPAGIDIEAARTYLYGQNLDAEAFFDEAYLYLELDDKIGPAKAFQSMYFFLRNSFVLSIISIVLLPIVSYLGNKETTMWHLALPVSITLLCQNLALFYRAKMTERILNSYSHIKKKADSLKK